MRHLFLLSLAFLAPVAMSAQAIVPPNAIQLPPSEQNGPKTDNEVQEEFTQAMALERESKWQPAADLLDDALRQRPKNGRFAEELASVEIHLAVQGSADQKLAHMRRAKELFDRAAANGDNSPRVQAMRDQFRAADLSGKPTQSAPDSPAVATLKEGDAQLNKGGAQAALALYQKAATLDPKLYEAPLYAGDAYFKLKKFDEAGSMYAKAVAIDPNRDTAYRYWGDALVQAGKLPEAEDKIIEGILCAPYTKSTWAYLDGWARTSHHTISSPAIKTPSLPSVDPTKPGNVNITVSAMNDKEPNAGAWMMYQLLIAGSMTPKDGKPARHSLEIEATALRAALKSAQDAKTAATDPSFVALAALEKDGMLESWILLNHADQGIAQDFLAYRNAHRQLMHAYIAKYVVHG